jgi:DNA-binding winged helix-turn-helix (wHTH) protein
MKPTRPFLEITGPDGLHRVIELTKSPMTIGRSSANDIVLQPDPRRLVSRQKHCYLEAEGSDWYVCHGHNTCNPTFLSREAGLYPVQDKVRLADGDRILIEGGLAETRGRLYWACQFRDPEGTRPSQSSFHLEYELNSHRLFSIAGKEPKRIHLSPQEDRLIRYMMECNGKYNTPLLIPISELMKAIWGMNAEQDHDPQELHKLISRLRSKIEVDPEKPQFLVNERGIGYYLNTHTIPDFAEKRMDSST